jgi:hypothetical protein
MRRSILVFLLVASLLAVGGAAASDSDSDSDDGRAIAGSASGWYGFTGTAAGSFFDVRPFYFRVKVFEDGSAKGKYHYRQLRDGVEITIAGSLTCGTIRGNQAWLGGVIEESNRANLIGLEMWFQVQDNAGKEPDMSTTIGAGGPGTGTQYCIDAPVVRFPFFRDSGRLNVNDRED